MTPEHLKKYRCFVRDWVTARKEKGLPHDDGARYDLHRRAIGRACSSTEFTQEEFTQVLRVLKRESSPADFNAQMQLQDADDHRRAAVLRRLDAALDVLVGLDSAHRQNYIDEMARRLAYGKTLVECSDREKAKIMGVLEDRARRQQKKGQPF